MNASFNSISEQIKGQSNRETLVLILRGIQLSYLQEKLDDKRRSEKEKLTYFYGIIVNILN